MHFAKIEHRKKLRPLIFSTATKKSDTVKAKNDHFWPKNRTLCDFSAKKIIKIPFLHAACFDQKFLTKFVYDHLHFLRARDVDELF